MMFRFQLVNRDGIVNERFFREADSIHDAKKFVDEFCKQEKAYWWEIEDLEDLDL